jgi:DNA-binding protein HU-beta
VPRGGSVEQPIQPIGNDDMNTAELVDHLAEEHGLTKVGAKQIVEDTLQAIVDAAKRGDEVSLAGFGKFKVQSRAARTGRNPQTGAPVKIAASKKLAFTPAKAVKDALNSPKSKRAKKK